MSIFERLPLFSIAWVLALVGAASYAPAQSSGTAEKPAFETLANRNAEQVAGILHLSELLNKLRTIRAQTACGSSASREELAIRQDILEAVEGSSLDADGVLAELESERSRLFELRAALQSRRDRSLGLLNIANLVTGTGLGIVTNALQFSDSTAKTGDVIGVVSGFGSTALSVISLRRQRGPQHSAGSIPNMLAPLFGRQPKLNSYYPGEVLQYLQSPPPAEGVESGSRLDQLMAEWKQAGRIGPAGSPKTDQQVNRLTSSLDTKTKLSIDDISDRMAMLSDVTGRVGLMKRDLAQLMRSMKKEKTCPGQLIAGGMWPGKSRTGGTLS